MKYNKFDEEDSADIEHQGLHKLPQNDSSVLGTLKEIGDTTLFMWMKPVLELGNRQPLDFADLLELNPEDQAETVNEQFQRAWNLQLTTKEIPSIIMAYAHAFGYPFYLAGGLKLIHDLLIFSGPYFLNKIIYFLDDPSQPLSVGLTYVALLFLTNCLMSLCLRQYFFRCFKVGMRLRSAVIASVFTKALAISAGVLSRRSIGEITNLMSVDSTRLQNLVSYLHAVWFTFLQMTLALYFLWQQVGVACLGGVTMIILAIPVTQQISAYLKDIQKELSVVRDQRVKLNNEVLGSMKVIKFQAWESEFQNRIDAAREKELAIYLRSIKMQLVSSMIYTALPLAVAICTFTAYIALGHNLDVATALTSLALFEILRFPLFMLPMIITNLVEAKVSVDRIQSFLMEPEKKLVPEAPLTDVGVKFNNATLVYDSIRKRLTKPTSMISNSVMPLVPTEATPTTTTQDQSLFAQIGRRVSILTTFAGEVLKLLFSKKAKPVGEQALMTDIEFELLIRRAQVEAMEKQITATETSNESKSPEVEEEEQGDEKRSEGGDESGERILTLFRVSMEAHRGALFCIVGKVGSGKSSVLLSVLGDLVCVLGEVSVKGRVAYVGQRPFIQNSTLKDNILFGRAYDEAKYLKTLEMCALLPDLEVLPAGDQTEIGERGINLSGGQKARVGLARAVYADAEVVLLDDPLAAVDAHVGQHLFEHCITPLVQAQKCVVLVTNALQFIRDANDIIVLDNGAIIEHGNFSQLLMMRGSFHDMMMAHADGMATADDARTREQLVEEDLIQVDLGAGIEEKFRANSVDSAKAVVSKQEPKKASIELISKVPKGQLIANEDREVGSVSMQVYLRWAMAAGGIHAGVLILVSYAFGECISVFSSYWLSYWSAHRDEHSAWFYLGIYIAIGVGILLTATGRDFYVALVGWKAGGHLFAGMVVSILHAPMSFFDTTPMGRILNRFTKDVLTVDVDIPRTVRTYLGTMSKVISTILYISVITPVFLIALGPIAFFYYKAQQYFIKTSRELTRLDSVSRSPIYALFSETLDGLTTIRAYGDEERLVNKSNSLLDKNQQAYFLNFSANCWLGIRLELAGTMIITFTALAAVLSRGFYVNDTGENRHEFAGTAGLAISLALGVTQSLNWSVRMASDLESQMVAVERIESFSAMEQEAQHVIPESDPSPESGWPTRGEIKMSKVSMRYRKDLPLVLDEVNVTIAAKEKVGIVGRTGAGKSSLVTAILRLVELDGGRVFIDGVDVSAIGLRRLRSCVAVIPQDPVLFSGTIRSNLDPFNLYTDEQCWESVRRTQLKGAVRTLQDRVDDNGSNFSVGQRQLLCISRALLSKARIIIMDEATAAVDVETDAAIQKTIREEFAYATCLTVAHRLNTILDSDKVMVMDKGKVIEYDSPQKLLSNPQSSFYSLVENWESSQRDE